MALIKNPKINAALAEMGVYSDYTALNHFPRKYDDFTMTLDENHLLDGQRLVVSGFIEKPIELVSARKVNIFRIYFQTLQGNHFVFTSFNQNYLLEKEIGPEHIYTVSGFVNLKLKQITFESLFVGVLPPERYLKPIYTLPKGLSDYHFLQIVTRAEKNLTGKIYDLIPTELIKKYQLLHREETFHKLHFPLNQDDINLAIKTLKFEEALMFSLRSVIDKELNRRPRSSNDIRLNHDQINAFFNELPYVLTVAQKRAVREIYNDLKSPFLMNRLLQGDVGSGKTLVAAIALHFNFLLHKQGALMVPSDTLARQHYETLNKLYANQKEVKIALLVGSLKASEKKAILKELEEGKINIIIGTHALFSKNVNYFKLGMIIIDEQHRFGTIQRDELVKRSDEADILMMSATPIPRTLSLGLFGELDVSILDENPLGNDRNVETKIVEYHATRIQQLVKNSLDNDKRIFIVAPKINKGDEGNSAEVLYEEYNRLYPNLVGLLHGKVSKEEQVKTMEDFRSGLKPILVSTTIIEVGIDIQSANLMLVYGASNFGLASLHQLRGRIGRDGSHATFVLIGDEEEMSQKQIQRLNILETTTDGALIAKQDLKMRGPGQIDGIKQSGSKDYVYLDPVLDQELLKITKQEANYILDHSFEREYQYILRLAREKAEKIKT